MEMAEISSDVEQTTKYVTQSFDSTFKWKLQNFANFPDSIYYTEKIHIAGTKFHWFFQTKILSGSTCSEPKLNIIYHSKKINEDDFKNFFFEFEAKIDNFVLWKEGLTQISPISIISFTGIVVSSLLKDSSCLEIDMKVTIKTSRLLKNVTIISNEMLNKLSDDFKLALEGDELKDCKFIVDNEVVSAHKAILAARSPVFKKMFTSKMKESKENLVVVPDIKLDTFKEILHFIYTGSVTSNFPVVVLELFVAAHKYQIASLIEKCETEIYQNLTEENAAAVHGLTKLFDVDESLKHEAFDLFKSKICREISDWKLGNDEKQKKIFSIVTDSSMITTKASEKSEDDKTGDDPE